MGITVRINIDNDAYQGHGLCYFHSDELFAIRDEDGKAKVLVDPVPERLISIARESADVCPERAIRVMVS